jgi:hypothetical protein
MRNTFDDGNLLMFLLMRSIDEIEQRPRFE